MDPAATTLSANRATGGVMLTSDMAPRSTTRRRPSRAGTTNLTITHGADTDLLYLNLGGEAGHEDQGTEQRGLGAG